ncbi:MAG: DUF3107 domain-containing protein [Acidimicrobiia bacterium]|nr:DUF3107 domain-containing protein [Acidimicrobiia bacterium]
MTYTAKEIDLELAPETDRDTLKRDVEHALADDERVLWLTDSHDRMVAVPSGKIAYVEIGSPEGDRRIGFASG